MVAASARVVRCVVVTLAVLGAAATCGTPQEHAPSAVVRREASASRTPAPRSSRSLSRCGQLARPDRGDDGYARDQLLFAG